MKGYVFRRNYPAVFGLKFSWVDFVRVEIINGRKKSWLIHQIQENGKPIDEAAKGEQVAVSIKEISVGRQINEGDVFFTDLNSKEAKLLSERFYAPSQPGKGSTG